MATNQKSKGNEFNKFISYSAFNRLIALQQKQVNAANSIVKNDSYSDFFVEGSGEPWHEAFPDVITGDNFRKGFSVDRMIFVDQIFSDDGYSDFFVEGSGDPWHEAFGDVVKGERFENSNSGRVRALGNLKVIQAYLKIRESIRK